MFAKLHQLASTGPVLITAAREGTDQLRINIVPKTVEGQDPGLGTPLSLVGTPAELEAGALDAIAEYVAARAGLETSLSEAKATMDAAAAAAKEKAAKKASPLAKPAAKPAEPAGPGASSRELDEDAPTPAPASAAEPPNLLALMGAPHTPVAA